MSTKRPTTFLDIPFEITSDIILFSKNTETFLTCKSIYSIWSTSKSIKARYLLTLYGKHYVLVRPELRQHCPPDIRVRRHPSLRLRRHPYFDEDVFMILVGLGARYRYFPLFPDAEERLIGLRDEDTLSSRIVDMVIKEYNWANGIPYRGERRSLAAKLGANCPLRWAASSGSMRALKFLVNNGADLEVVDRDRGIPYGLACIASCLRRWPGMPSTPEQVQRIRANLATLLDNLPGLDQHPDWIDWAVGPSVVWFNLELTQMLTSRGGQLIPRKTIGNPEDPRLYLGMACAEGEAEIFKLMLPTYLDGSEFSRSNPRFLYQPTFSACRSKVARSAEIVKYIYDNFPLWTATFNLEPLKTAIQAKRRDIVEYFMQHERLRHIREDTNLAYCFTYLVMAQWKDIFLQLLETGPTFELRKLVLDLMTLSKWDRFLQDILIGVSRCHGVVVSADDLVPMVFGDPPSIPEQQEHIVSIVRRMVLSKNNFAYLCCSIWSGMERTGRNKVHWTKVHWSGSIGELLIELFENGVRYESSMDADLVTDWQQFVGNMKTYRAGNVSA
ncbi:hypothetical protein HK104_004819 [Borealophlyctis nickersoniae]|nr:hypothetical protein HK104_004819 [Borealophlyctis nickersoniae]